MSAAQCPQSRAQPVGTPVGIALPSNLKAQPRLGLWLGLNADGTVRAYSGKVELGQGILHTLSLIVAQELGLALNQVTMVSASTAHSPDEAVTSGSLSVQDSGSALRHAAAHLREVCRQRYAQRHGVALDTVRVQDGVFTSPSTQASAGYANLVDAALWEQDVDGCHVQAHARATEGGAPQCAQRKPVAVPTDSSALRSTQRADIAAKVFGQFEYISDMTLPGMVYGAVFRPKTLNAQVDAARAAELQAQLRGLPGVLHVLRDGLLIGVLANTERVLAQAARAVQQANVWHGEVQVPPANNISAWLKAQPLETTVVVELGADKNTGRSNTSNPTAQSNTAPAATSSQPPAPPLDPSPTSTRTLRAEFERPYLQHASIGLCCALAQWQGEALHVWSHSQGIFNLRRDLALSFAVPATHVTVQHAPNAGCYGHNGADDVAFDAAWLARHAHGQPVRVLWSREQEMAHAPLGPAMAVAIEADLDNTGRITRWQQQVWSPGHGTRPGRGATPALLGAWQTSTPCPVPMAVNAAMAVGGGSERNAQPPYAIAQVQVLNHRVLTMPLRVSALRALGAHANVFAAESFMDELAEAAGQEPLAFRLAHLQDPRAIAVLQEAARLAQWRDSSAAATLTQALNPPPLGEGRNGGVERQPPAPTPTQEPPARPEGYGRGIAYARYKNTGAYCAVVAEIIVTQAIQLTRLHIAADLGRVIHPDGARNQLEGGAVQAASWTLCEAAQFDGGGITSVDWQSYPILTFRTAPQVQIALMPRDDCPAMGAGECASGPTAAAIANALHNALGVRVRSLPLSADNLMRWLQAA